MDFDPSKFGCFPTPIPTTIPTDPFNSRPTGMIVNGAQFGNHFYLPPEDYARIQQVIPANATPSETGEGHTAPQGQGNMNNVGKTGDDNEAVASDKARDERVKRSVSAQRSQVDYNSQGPTRNSARGSRSEHHWGGQARGRK